MRAVYLAIALLVGGCQPSDQQKPAERIEIRQSGWDSLDISMSSDGTGSFARSNIEGPLGRNGEPPAPITGTFRISPTDFRSLEAQLSEFRSESVPRTEASIRQMIDGRCPEGVPFVTDNGAIYIRWIGKGFDRHYLVRLGCDRERNARKNTKLLELIRRLPISAS